MENEPIVRGKKYQQRDPRQETVRSVLRCDRGTDSQCYEVEPIRLAEEPSLGVRNEGETGIRHGFLGSWFKQLDERGCHSEKTDGEDD